MSNNTKEIIKWFENIGHRYVNNILTVTNLDELRKDPNYAKKMFLYYWAYERQGAPLGYKIAAIKTLETVKNEEYSNEFYKYYKGKKNKINNPILDKRISKLNILDIIKKIEHGNFEEAFNDLKLNGIGHKIRAFFIRDIVYLLINEDLLDKSTIVFPDYLFMNPIDIWVRLTVEYLELKKTEDISVKKNKYDMDSKDFNVAVALTSECLEYGISPLLTNMGMWYYASQFVADKGRLEKLLKKKSVEVLENEMSLLKGFSEVKRSLI